MASAIRTPGRVASVPANLGHSRGRQTAWLDRTLGRLRAADGIDFVVVFFHHCAYSTSRHSSDGGVRREWPPLFAKHRVDLVINVKDSYEGHVTRHRAVDTFAWTKGGDRAPETVEWSRVRYTGFSLLSVEVRAGAAPRLVVSALGQDGRRIDHFEVRRGG